MVTLDDALNNLRNSVNKLSDNMKEVRHMVSNTPHNVIIANKMLQLFGYEDESIEKLEQWGILDAQDDCDVCTIIGEVIDNRRDHTLHHCE